MKARECAFYGVVGGGGGGGDGGGAAAATDATVVISVIKICSSAVAINPAAPHYTITIIIAPCIHVY